MNYFEYNCKQIIKANIIHFNSMNGTKFIAILDKFSHLFVKFRIFDKFYYPPMQRSCGYHILEDKDSNFSGKEVIEDFYESVNNTYSWIICVGNKEVKGYIFDVYGYYCTKNYIVFCSYPSYDTLVKSFKNNFTVTASKFSNCYNIKYNYVCKIFNKIIQELES